MKKPHQSIGWRLDHGNIDNPHTHLIMRGRDDAGKDLIIAGDYIAHGSCHRAAELATEWLRRRTEVEIQQNSTGICWELCAIGELVQTAGGIATATGLERRLTADGQRVAGICQRASCSPADATQCSMTALGGLAGDVEAGG